MMYCIAYKDGNGNGFGEYPWIEEVGSTLIGAKNRKEVYSNQFTSMVIFEYDPEDRPEIITWEFVNEHKVE